MAGLLPVAGLTQYSLGDLLLFSEATYFELLSYYHHDIWPLQLVAIVLSGVCCWLLCKPGLWCQRIVLVIFAASWIWSGIVFQGNYYSDINWLVTLFEGLFCIQGGLFLWLVFRHPRSWKAGSQFTAVSGRGGNNPVTGRVAEEAGNSNRSIQPHFASVAIIAGIALLLPLFLLLKGRHWDQLEIIFVTPDATVAATFGLLWWCKYNFSWWILALLALIPFIWGLFSLATWSAMASVSGG